MKKLPHFHCIQDKQTLLSNGCEVEVELRPTVCLGRQAPIWDP
jgi:hypothetical protein